MGAEKIIGVIGGSGFYAMEGVQVLEEKTIETPFGPPSDAYLITRIGDTKVVFLPRHGRGHRFNPSQVNYRANVYGMKVLGVEAIISVGAVGSLREHLKPGHIVLATQFFDRTRGLRASTYFEDGIVAHVPFADPVSLPLTDILYKAAVTVPGVQTHPKGVYVCIEGPQFSTRAESLHYRTIGADIIGMTNLTEAKLAREAEISYASLCLVTDYDCWRRGDDVDVVDIMEVMARNVANAQSIVKAAVPLVAAADGLATEVLATAIVTRRDLISPEVRKRLAPIIGPYL